MYIETLEGRSLFSAATLSPHVAEVPAALANFNSYGVAGVTLRDGRLLAVGIMQDTKGNDTNFYVRYNTDGSLDRTFGIDGIAIQSSQRMKLFGQLSGVFAMPDDSILVQFPEGLRRLTAAGQFDMSYGTNGFAPYEIINDQRQSDGTTLAVTAAGDGFRLVRFNARGDVLRVGALQNPDYYSLNSTQVLANGLIAHIGPYDKDYVDNEMTLTSTDFQPVKTFGVNGALDLDSTIGHAISAQGKWYADASDQGSFSFGITTVSTARDGGYVLDIAVSASHTKLTKAQIAAKYRPLTWLYLHLSATGKLVSINGDDDRTSTAFYATAGQFGGTFHFDQGSDATYSLGQGPGTVTNVTTGPATSYLIGETGTTLFEYGLGHYYINAPSTASSTPYGHFTVVVMRPPGGTIAGTLFSDRDHDGVFDSGELTIADRTVYLDSDNNGKLDPGEQTTTTDAKGRYTFSDLGPGKYVVRRVLPAGYKTTTSNTAVTITPGSSFVLNLGSTAIAA